MKFTIDTDKIAQRLEKLANQAGEKVKVAAKVTGPRASSLADKASKGAQTILEKLDATREYLERKVADRANGVVETTKVERHEKKAETKPKKTAASGPRPKDERAEPEKTEAFLTVQFDRMGVHQEDSQTSHAQSLTVKPNTTVTEFFASLLPLLPPQPSTCWILRARRSQESAFTDMGYILCDASLVRKPVSLLGEATLGELKLDKVMGLFRLCETFHMGTEEEAHAVEKALN